MTTACTASQGRAAQTAEEPFGTTGIEAKGSDSDPRRQRHGLRYPLWQTLDQQVSSQEVSRFFPYIGGVLHLEAARVDLAGTLPFDRTLFRPNALQNASTTSSAKPLGSADVRLRKTCQ